jgi:hypothetical protein
MRKISLSFLLALAIPFALGQGVFIPPQTALKVVNGYTTPIANATITVCAANASGIPCSPALANSIFKDTGLTQPLSNPFTSDALGNYQFAAGGGTYTVTVTAVGFVGQSYQVTTGGGGGGGSGCVVNPADGGCALAGSPSIDFFIGSVGPGTGWLAQWLNNQINFKNALSVASDGNAGRISIACGPDPGVGSNITIAAPVTCVPYTIYLPPGSSTGYLFVSANGNKLTLSVNSSINLQTDVGSTILPLANGGTNGTSQQQAAINVLPPIGRGGDVIYANSGNWTIFSGCTVSTCIYTENGGGTPGWLNTPIPPLDGGTGLTTLTTGCIYKGNGTAAMLCSALSDDGAKVTSTEPIKLPVSVFSALATCAAGIEGEQAAVSDSTTNTWGATITGSGANHVLAYCDGTNWTVAGK